MWNVLFVISSSVLGGYLAENAELVIENTPIDIKVSHLDHKAIKFILEYDQNMDRNDQMDRCIVITGLDKVAICESPDNFPEDLPIDTEILTISCEEGRGLFRIDEKQIGRYLNLQKLYLEGCQIETLDGSTFKNNKNLIYISLKNLPIKTIAGDILLELRKLEYFEIIDCPKLYNIDPIIFAAQNQLKTIKFVGLNFTQENFLPMLSDLSGCLKELIITNHKSVMNIDTFSLANITLDVLDLSKNILKDIKFLQFTTTKFLNLSKTIILSKEISRLGQWFPLANSLETLDYSYHPIKEIKELVKNDDFGYYSLFSKLREIHLIESWIWDLNKAITQAQELFKNLRILNLAYSQVSDLQVDSINKYWKRMLEVNLVGNPIHCNCLINKEDSELRWLKPGINNLECGSMAIMSTEMNYSKEPCKAGTPISQIKKNYKLVCFEPQLPQISAYGKISEKLNLFQTNNDETVMIKIFWNDSKLDEIKIECKTVADPPPDIKWLIGGKVVEEIKGQLQLQMMLRKIDVIKMINETGRNPEFKCKIENFLKSHEAIVEVILGGSEKLKGHAIIINFSWLKLTCLLIFLTVFHSVFI